MGSKPKKLPATADHLSRGLPNTPATIDPDDAARARVQYDPVVRAGRTGRYFIKPLLGESSPEASVSALLEQVESVNKGNLSGAERTLVSQANTLDAIFNEMARRAALNMDEYPGVADVYLRLGLKAQSQCRATLETLVMIKSPPVIFARQANVTTGPQQINNGTAPPPPTLALAGKTEIPQIQLSEVDHELPQDTRAPCLAGRDNPPLEALGTVDRTDDDGGESKIRQPQLQRR